MIKIYTIAVNRPDFIVYQRETLRKFLAEEHDLIVINDGTNGHQQKIAETADSLGLKSFVVQEPRRDTANYAHARSLEWAWDRLIQHDDDISVILDGDMFLGAPFSVREWMKNADLSGIAQGREHVVYLWPGLVFLNTPNLPNRHTLSFWPDVVDGQRVDVGGHSYEYIRANPSVRVKWILRNGEDRGCIPTDDEFRRARSFGMEVALSFLHYRCGTNWDHQSAEHHAEKSKLLCSILDRAMHSG